MNLLLCVDRSPVDGRAQVARGPSSRGRARVPRARPPRSRAPHVAAESRGLSARRLPVPAAWPGPLDDARDDPGRRLRPTTCATSRGSRAAHHAAAGWPCSISDFFDPAGAIRGLALLRGRGLEVGALHVVDPADADLPVGASIVAVDRESGESIRRQRDARRAGSGCVGLERRASGSRALVSVARDPLSSASTPGESLWDVLQRSCCAPARESACERHAAGLLAAWTLARPAWAWALLLARPARDPAPLPPPAPRRAVPAAPRRSRRAASQRRGLAPAAGGPLPRAPVPRPRGAGARARRARVRRTHQEPPPCPHRRRGRGRHHARASSPTGASRYRTRASPWLAPPCSRCLGARSPSSRHVDAPRSSSRRRHERAEAAERLGRLDRRGGRRTPRARACPADLEGTLALARTLAAGRPRGAHPRPHGPAPAARRAGTGPPSRPGASARTADDQGLVAFDVVPSPEGAAVRGPRERAKRRPMSRDRATWSSGFGEEEVARRPLAPPAGATARPS